MNESCECPRDHNSQNDIDSLFVVQRVKVAIAGIDILFIVRVKVAIAGIDILFIVRVKVAIAEQTQVQISEATTLNPTPYTLHPTPYTRHPNAGAVIRGNIPAIACSDSHCLRPCVCRWNRKGHLCRCL